MERYEFMAQNAEKILRESYSYYCIREKEVEQAITTLHEDISRVSNDKDLFWLLRYAIKNVPDVHLGLECSSGDSTCAGKMHEETNYSRDTVLPYLNGMEKSGPVIWGEIGNIFYVGTESAHRRFEEDYRKLCNRECPENDAFIIDFRANTGGRDTMMKSITSALLGPGEKIASQYIRRRTSRINPHQLSDYEPWFIDPNEHSRRRKVAVLIGPQTFSSGENMAMDFSAIPGAITIGYRTGGGSAGSRLFPLDGPDACQNIDFDELNKHNATFALRVPQWLKYRRDKVLLEGNGIVPDIMIPIEQTYIDGHDLVLEQAIKSLQ